MQFGHSVVDATAGAVIEVTLDVQANVLLLDSTNLSLFRAGNKYRYFGGHFKVSPARVRVPQTGRWNLVVYNPAGGPLRWSARVLQ